MKKFHLILLVLVSVVFIFGEFPLWGSRIKDISNVKGVRENQLVGFGLVVGLNGTGDSKGALFTSKAISFMLTKMGITTSSKDVLLKNAAAVLVTGTLKPFAQIGDRVDLTLSSIGDAKSLGGGMLIKTPLLASDQEVYAVGQGTVSLGGVGSKSLTEHKTVVRIPNGGIIEKDMSSQLAKNGLIELTLHDPDFSTAYKVEKQINLELGGFFAQAQNSGSIHVTVPEYYKERLVRFVSILENVEVETSRKAVVVINERTGTIVMGSEVRIKTVAISHGDLSLLVGAENAQEGEKEEAGGEEGETTEEVQKRLNVLQEGADIGLVVKALNTIGVTPQDLIIILQTLKAQGSLEAELRFI